MISGDDIIPRQMRVNKKRQRLNIEDHNAMCTIKSTHNVDVLRGRNVMTLLSRGRRSAFFVTEDSQRYISQKQQEYLSNGYRIENGENKIDSVHTRFIEPIDRRGEFVAQLERRYGTMQGSFLHMREMMSMHISPFKMWNASLIGAILFGMISMTLIYRNLGQGVFADASDTVLAAANNTTPAVGLVLGTSDSKDDIEKLSKKKDEEEEKEALPIVVDAPKEKSEAILPIAPTPTKIDPVEDVKGMEKLEKRSERKSVDAVIVNNKKDVGEDLSEKQTEKRKVTVETLPIVENTYETTMKEMVKGYPIEKMLPHLFQQDPTVAAYYIAIAKIESNWGKRVPVLNGQDCYNYVGYRGKRARMGSGQHTCFDSPKDAVDTVSKRLHDLVYKYDRKTPAQMVVWKCGSSCEGHGDSAQRWIDHVGGYFHELTKHL